MNTFKVYKKSGTYSESLEAYGLANLLKKIFDNNQIANPEIIIKDEGLYYTIITHSDISNDDLKEIKYFDLFPYIKRDVQSEVDTYTNYYDYPKQKELKKDKQELIEKIYKEYKDKNEREKKLKEIDNIFKEHKFIDPSIDVYQQLASYNNFVSYKKLYLNIYNNKDIFPEIIHQILSYYSEINYNDKEFDNITKDREFHKKITANQLLNPNKGKGIKSTKANSAANTNFDSYWIPETMKISGAITDMICQLVKVGSNSYDLKIFVSAYKQVKYSFKQTIIPDFKKHLKGNTPIKIDILNILTLTKIVIQNSGYTIVKQKVKNIIDGLHSVYQKDLGQGKAVVNIGYIQVPSFIEISNKEQNDDWIDLLDEQINIINGIDELGETINGLMLYRNFISTSNIYNFFDFSYWYAIYLSTKLSKNEFVIPYKIKTLNKLYKNMETKELKLSEIISNPGFQAVAKAIRNSTISLQFMPTENRKYEVRYGLAQELQSKSKSKKDLSEFIGEFISFYNSETARSYEKEGRTYRSTVRSDELNEFYSLLDKYPSKLIGALLASYGFALPSKEIKITEQNEENIENN